MGRGYRNTRMVGSPGALANESKFGGRFSGYAARVGTVAKTSPRGAGPLTGAPKGGETHIRLPALSQDERTGSRIIVGWHRLNSGCQYAQCRRLAFCDRKYHSGGPPGELRQDRPTARQHQRRSATFQPSRALVAPLVHRRSQLPARELPAPTPLRPPPRRCLLLDCFQQRA